MILESGHKDDFTSAKLALGLGEPVHIRVGEFLFQVDGYIGDHLSAIDSYGVRCYFDTGLRLYYNEQQIEKARERWGVQIGRVDPKSFQ